MKIVETKQQFDDFLKNIKNKKIIIIPIFSDHILHPIDNSLSLLYVRIITTNQRYVLVFDHSEGLSLDYKCIESFREYTKILTFDKKILSHAFQFYDNIFDMHILSYLSGKDVPELNCETNTHHYIYNHLRTRPNLNRLVPIVKHFEVCEKISDILMSYDVEISSKVYSFYNDIAIPAFAEIEKAGLKTHDKYLFSEYNFYTATGRPSNRFGGINFAALHKKDGSRKKFISRFENGGLLQFDYSAYHLRLIGDIINYDLPSESMHTYLGRQYFNKDDLTEKEYDESKKISFKFLYGTIYDDIAEAIPYFGEVKKYVDKLWDEINAIGYIESPISGRRIYKDKIDSINSTKLFNYSIQLIETEKNCLIMKKVQDFLTEYETKLVLYTYDSFLFDIDFNDGKDFFIQLRNIIEQNGKFPTTVKIGRNYNEMKNFIFPYL